MDRNILTAFLELHKTRNMGVDPKTNKPINRINEEGDPLEKWFKKLFDPTFENNEDKYDKEIISHPGSKNNPPDFILRNGDAFEIKKIGNVTTSNIALNSSFPKDKLYSKDPKLTDDCRNCESTPWVEKELFYVIGVQPKYKPIKCIFVVHAACIANSYSAYEKHFNDLKQHIESAQQFNWSKTNELGKIHLFDPAKKTSLRVRPMYAMENPFKTFEKYIHKSALASFLITEEQYKKYPQMDKNNIEKDNDIRVEDININSPKEPNGQTISCKIFSFS